MKWFIDLVTNPFFMTPIISWFVAQIIKTILHAIANRSVDFKRMMGDGGMPSCHSTTVASLAFLCLLHFGIDSFQFAISVILAIIVCHDAYGVRQEAGKHAAILNKLMEESDQDFSEYLPKGKLNMYIGHRPAEVFVGVFIGIGMAIVMYFVFF